LSVKLLGGRSDLIRGLRGHATALAGNVAIGAMCLWEWAHGRDGSPYAQLGALAGVAYLVALALLRLRS
jgi:hypothetical protein